MRVIDSNKYSNVEMTIYEAIKSLGVGKGEDIAARLEFVRGKSVSRTKLLMLLGGLVADGVILNFNDTYFIAMSPEEQYNYRIKEIGDAVEGE